MKSRKWTQQSQLLLTLILIPLLLLSGCAARGNKNLTPQTTWLVNTGTLLSTLQDQYKGFYTDVGDAHRAGTLSDSQVTSLNHAGEEWRTTLGTANQLYKQYVATKDDNLKTQVIGLVAKAEQIALTLLLQKQQMEGKR